MFSGDSSRFSDDSRSISGDSPPDGDDCRVAARRPWISDPILRNPRRLPIGIRNRHFSEKPCLENSTGKLIQPPRKRSHPIFPGPVAHPLPKQMLYQTELYSVKYCALNPVPKHRLPSDLRKLGNLAGGSMWRRRISAGRQNPLEMGSFLKM